MDGSSYFLDSNIIIDLFRGNTEIKDFINQNVNVFIPVVVVGELYYGAENASQSSKHRKQVNDFIQNFEVVNIDSISAEYYGKIKTQLRQAGKPIPENDIWIAALTLQHNCTIVTNDVHFENVNLLRTKKI